MMHSSTAPDRCRPGGPPRARRGAEWARESLRDPRNLPVGVRTAAAITASRRDRTDSRIDVEPFTVSRRAAAAEARKNRVARAFPERAPTARRARRRSCVVAELDRRHPRERRTHGHRPRDQCVRWRGLAAEQLSQDGGRKALECRTIGRSYYAALRWRPSGDRRTQRNPGRDAAPEDHRGEIPGRRRCRAASRRSRQHRPPALVAGRHRVGHERQQHARPNWRFARAAQPASQVEVRPWRTTTGGTPRPHWPAVHPTHPPES